MWEGLLKLRALRLFRLDEILIFCHNFRMCGRFRLSRRKQVVMERFDSVSDEPDWEPRYNISPTQRVAVVRQNPEKPYPAVGCVRHS